MNWVPIVAGIVPSIGVGLIFWYAMRGVIRADRNERAALAEVEAQHDAADAKALQERQASAANTADAAAAESFTEQPATAKSDTAEPNKASSLD